MPGRVVCCRDIFGKYEKTKIISCNSFVRLNDLLPGNIFLVTLIGLTALRFFSTLLVSSKLEACWRPFQLKSSNLNQQSPGCSSLTR